MPEAAARKPEPPSARQAPTPVERAEPSGADTGAPKRRVSRKAESTAAEKPAERPAPPVQRVEPPPAAPLGQVDAAAVRRIWPEVLDAVKRRRRTTHALLMNVSVRSVEDGVLTLSIASEPLSRLLAEEINTDCVRGAVRDLLGVDWRVRVAMDAGSADADQGSPAPAQPPAEEDPREDEPNPPAAATDEPAGRPDPEQAAISLLESTLGARRVEDRA